MITERDRPETITGTHKEMMMIWTRTPKVQLLAFAVVATAALVATLLWTSTAEAQDPAEFAITETAVTASTTQAGAHPDFTTTIGFATDPGTDEIHSRLRDVKVDLPPGVIGNPNAFPSCSMAIFAAYDSVDDPPCPLTTQVGVATLRMKFFGDNSIMNINEPLYNLPAPDGVPARLGFIGVFYPVVLDFKVRSDGDYGLRAVAEGINSRLTVNRSEITTWGVPADPSHDELRVAPFDALFEAIGAGNFSNSSPLAPTAFMSNPTSCEGPGNAHFDVLTYRLPGQHFQADTPWAANTGCDDVPFDPESDFGLTSHRQDSASGLTFNLSIPQDGIADPTRLRQSDLKKAVVTLPEGMSINPSAANGRKSCGTEQIGLTSTSPIRFDAEPAECPDASKVGEVRIETPLLNEDLTGSMYIADQKDNPFDTLLSGYMVAEGAGVRIKLPGRFDLDEQTGRITATFDNNPQLPFSSLDLEFYGGPKAPLATPPTCGTYEITTELTPWSGGDPVVRTTPYTVEQGPDGGPCLAGDPTEPGDPADLADRPFNPEMNAGVKSAVAGSYSPFVFRLTREDGEQEILSTQVTPPKGLTAKLSGIPYCSEADIEANSCPEQSRIGTEIAGAGAGSSPFYTTNNPGSVYLAGPYKGAPLSMVIEDSVIAGPFDLKDISVRARIHVDPRTAQLTVISDEIPQIVDGIPLRIRDLRIRMDRDDFTIAPTNCDPMQVGAQVQGSHGAQANLTNHFQVGDCGSLGFSPDLDLSFGSSKKDTKANSHPPLNAKLSFNEGDANISSVEVALPQGLFLDQDRLGRICSRANYAAESCPEESVVGYAKAETPLLDDPVEGPVYLKASDNPLPDLAADLNGQIDVDLFGKIDQKQNKKGLNQIRNTFDIVPDVPVSDFELTLDGGSDGLLVNSRNICKSKTAQKVSIEMQAHNEMTLSERPLIGSACKQINAKKASKLKAKAKKLLKKAKKADDNRKAKKLRKQARKLKKQARKLGR